MASSGSPARGSEPWTSEIAAMTASSRITGRIDSSAAPDSVDSQSTFAPSAIALASWWQFLRRPAS